MLILSRKQEESVVIGNDIIVKVVSVDKGSVKLGFEAPPKTLILRAELTEAVKSENAKATGDAIGKDILDALGVHLKSKYSKEINAKDAFKKEQGKQK
ncbi:carbon storage regulator [Helicobacter didelphidarum]|uniref:Translational regulator CsrA n=1 Tax=Helicobacter didelphidarum TaxID=2040648 RepID=A0A3D8ILA2_9HELI|nr:carbon storage regulator CsrA [Helicobacter didelphidarum]RDU65893.1 carbon storage regulator [Helicobacter didelphidarum]